MASNSDDGGKKLNASLTTKPYLMRAIYDWALDNGFTPQVLIATDQPDVVVPRQYIKDNQIILNIHPQSVSGLDLGDEVLWCSTRFSGKPMEITAPVSSILAIYARENGQGIVFQHDDNGIDDNDINDNDITPPKNPPPQPPKSDSKKKLKLKTSAKMPDTKDIKKSTPAHLKLVK